MASLVDLSNLPELSNGIDRKNFDDTMLANEEISLGLNEVLDDSLHKEGVEPMKELHSIRDDTMEDALQQLETVLKMKYVDEDDQEEAAALADALLFQAFRRSGVDNNDKSSKLDYNCEKQLLHDPSLWRAHSVLSEVSQIGLWTQQNNNKNNTSHTDSGGGSDGSFHVTNDKLEHYMENIKSTTPLGGWRDN